MKTLLVAMSIFLGQPAAADHAEPQDRTVTAHFEQNYGTWEGWGTSLAWWGNAVGGSQYQSLYDDLLFTRNEVDFLGRKVPGLGMNLVRYNVGGCGMPGDKANGIAEALPSSSILPWFRVIRGFWVDGTPNGWDWNRDANQRAVLEAAYKRGAKIELFANAPEWWMTAEKSSCGGKLLPEHFKDFAIYLATVTQKAMTDWRMKIESVEPFNEPAAGWWKYPHNQEGCNLTAPEQAQIILLLRYELDKRGLQKVGITASDENSMDQAVATLKYFKAHPSEKPAAGAIDRLAVHSYNGIKAWTDNSVRKELRAEAGTRPIWSSEFGDPEDKGLTLAKTILSDIHFLHPTAWIYWQAVEATSAWGLVNAQFDRPEDEHSPERAKPLRVHTKYFVFAQFSRFLKPGMTIYGTDDPETVLGYDSHAHALVLVTLNEGDARTIHYDLGLKIEPHQVTVTTTTADATKELSPSMGNFSAGHLSISADADSVTSIEIHGFRLPEKHG